MLLHRETRPASTWWFVPGEAIPYLGRNYRLKVLDGPFKAPKLDKGRLVVSVPGGSGPVVAVTRSCSGAISTPTANGT